ncbi:MAG TPA: DUF222 domain-containing protein [Gammaproteobacteria bacterium]|nr:DUF222 domain-containing protein [Gammaproteobacteria bacterium]
MEPNIEASLTRFSPTAFTPQQQAFVDLEARMTELWANLNAGTYCFLQLLAEYDRTKGYERHGLVNSAQWLNWMCGIGTVAAREKVRVARALENLPQISALFAKGELSYSKVRAMTRVATPATESVLVHVALHGTASHVEKLVQKYRWTERRDAGKLAQQRHLDRQLSYFFDGDDFVLYARLPPEVGMIVRKALEAAGDLLRASAIDPAAQREGHIAAGTWALAYQEMSAGAKRADALRLLAETFLANPSDEPGFSPNAERYQVVVHVDQAVLQSQIEVDDSEPHRCELDDGPALALDTVRRLSCDAATVGIVEGGDGEPLDIGRKTRVIPVAIQRALRSRDGGCRFPGCDRTRFTEGHHVKHWADGGETKLSNLVTLCGFHHGLVHEGGFGVSTTDDGLFLYTRPDGQRIPDAGKSFRGNISGEEQTPRICALNREAGVQIDASTGRCGWLGETMDYSTAIEGMQSLRDRAAGALQTSPET